MSVITYRDAVRLAIQDAMRRDDRVFLMGEDVGHYGGCFAVSKGLLEEFGPERVRDTPMSESAFVGAGIGAALGGMRPIVEIMTVNFSLLALDQIMNNAATFLHMSGGVFNVPVVIRMATGGGRQVAAQHSHSLEGWYAHIPGIKILTPATHEDARGMLWTALQDPDPVLIFEHSGLYNKKGELPADAGPVDVDRARIRRTGRDVTLITYGAGVWQALEAAEGLASKSIECEVIDLRTLRPLDDSDVSRICGEDSSRRRHRRRLAQRGPVGGNLRAHSGEVVLRSGRTGAAGLQRGSPGPLCETSRGRLPPERGEDCCVRRRNLPHRRESVVRHRHGASQCVSTGCPASAPTWRKARSLNGP